MLKILHLIETSGPGGAENVLLNIINSLDKGSYISTVCLLKEGWLNDQLKQRGIETIIIPLNHTLDINWIRQTIHIIKAKNIQVLHSHEFAMNLYSSLLAKLTKIPAITTVHGKNYYCDKWHRKLAYRFVSRQSKMIAVSKDIQKLLTESVKISPDKITVVPNGIDTNSYKPDVHVRTRIRRELNIADNQCLVGNVANLYPVKGQKNIIDAAAIMLKKNPDTVFIIVGRGHLHDDLENQAINLGIKDQVRLLGFRSDVPEILQALDIFVLPSLSEGIPLSILEAMATGKPVIATRVGGIPEVIQDGVNGILIKPGDSNMLANKIESLVSDQDLTKKIANNGRRMVLQKFSLSAMLKTYSAMYHQLAKI